MSIAAMVGVSVVGIPLLYLGYYLLGPEIDNLVGWCRTRDLNRFLNHQVGEQPLRQIVETRLGSCRWSSRHDEVIWATNIECTDARERTLSWELSHLPPREWLPKQRTYITPLNRTAAEVTPELLPVGVRASHLAVRAWGAGAVHDSGRATGSISMAFTRKPIIER
jgi:hypothetical protein